MSKYTVWAVQVLYDEQEVEADSPEVARDIARRMYQETGELDPSIVEDGDYGVEGYDEWALKTQPRDDS